MTANHARHCGALVVLLVARYLSIGDAAGNAWMQPRAKGSQGWSIELSNLRACPSFYSFRHSSCLDKSHHRLRRRGTNHPPLSRRIKIDLPATSAAMSSIGKIRGGDSAAPSAPNGAGSAAAAAAAAGGRGEAAAVACFLNAVDLFGTGIFAFSGAVTAGKKGMDLLGMAVIATITAVGGGTVRDMLLGAGPVFWIREPVYLKISVAVALLTYLLYPIAEERMGWTDSDTAVCVADAFSLGAFAVLGTQKGVDAGLAPAMWVVCGLVSCCFGGIIRDTLCLQRPRVLYPYRTLYATPPLLGSVVYTLLLSMFKVGTPKAACATFAVTFLSRLYCFNDPLRLPHWKGAGYIEGKNR